MSLLDEQRGRIATASAPYPLHRRHDDPEYATQSHADHLSALQHAMHAALSSAELSGDAVVALALDTTGSSVVPVDRAMQPLDEYYLWCDHRAGKEAEEITALAHKRGLEAIQWCGGVYSHEWGWQNCCIGCATIPRDANSLRPPLSIAT